MIQFLSVIMLSFAGFLFSGLIFFAEMDQIWRSALSLNFLLISPMQAVLLQMLDDPQKSSGKNFWKKVFSIRSVLVVIPIIVAFITLMPGVFNYSKNQELFYCPDYVSVFMLILHILVLVYSLFMLENIYRYAHLYQRRLGWVSFVGSLVLVCYQLIFSTNWLLYGWVSIAWFKYSAYIYMVSLLAILWSFVRYRMNNEKIKVTRDAVYSSFSLLIIGALFTAVGLTFSILRSFNVTLSPFDFKVIGMSVLFASTILAGSARMRRRIAKLVNRRFYSTRYDYRSQFFSLHRILGRVEGYEETLEELLEHLRKSLNADHAYLFIANEQNGNYELLTPKERNLPRSLVIKSSSPIIDTLHKKGDYFGLLSLKNSASMNIHTESELNFNKLEITDVAPVLHYSSLFAILALKWDVSDGYDTEDIALIEAYTSVIADFLFRHRILRERLEQKQFESFSHMASFIVHDVKNQVATLKLLVRNAQKNISNPDFQESLLSSLRSCTANLDNLVSKLSMPPRIDRLKKIKTDISLVVKRLVEDSALNDSPDIELDTDISPGLFVVVDEGAIYYTIKNFLVNAIESMHGGKGKLEIRAFLLGNSTDWLLSRFPGRESFFSSYSIVVSVEDNGCGMDEDFLKNQLFRPFSTTKDKGIGIGLYQCKTLVEQMGGKVICESKVGRGTLFCILL